MNKSVCFKCQGPKIDQQKKWCESCRAAQRAKALEIRKGRKSRGLCIKCGSQLDRTGSLCKRCLRNKQVRAKPGKALRCMDCNRKLPKEVLVGKERGVARDQCASCFYTENFANYLQNKLIVRIAGGECWCCGETRSTFLRLVSKDLAKLDAYKDIAALPAHCDAGNLRVQDALDKIYGKEGYLVGCYNCLFSAHRYGACEHQPQPWFAGKAIQVLDTLKQVLKEDKEISPRVHDIIMEEITEWMSQKVAQPQEGNNE